MLLPLLVSSLALALCQEEEHFLDVKQIVKGTIEAIQRLPDATLQTNTSTQKPEDIYSLFRLPADIMTKLAVNAGYLDEPTTTSSPYGPWIVARPKSGKEDSVEESGEWGEVRRKRRRKRPEDNGLVSLKDLLKPLPGVQQPLPQPQLPSVLPPATSFMAQSDPVRTSQDPLYRREVTSDGQVRFVPVFSSPTKPSSIVVATPRPVQQSNQQFEAPTFPPQINPFQPRVLPPRIVLPQAAAPQMMSVPAVSQQLPMADPITPATTTTNPEPVSTRKPPLVVQPVMRPEAEDLKPRTMETTTTTESSKQVIESASMEDDAVIHSEESVSTDFAKKSTVTKTALRVRTIEHSKPHIQEEEEEVEEKEPVVYKPKKLSSKKRAKTMKVEEEEPSSTTVQPPTAERPTLKFEKAMEDIENGQISQKKRVHASKTLQIGRKGNKELAENEDKVSEELEQLSGESDLETTTMTTKRRRKHHFRKMTPTTTEATTTTTTTETPTTTEARKEKKGRKKSGRYGKKRARKNKGSKRLTTTTANPVAVTPQHCSNIRSFARQFGVLDLEKFARSQCEFIENYYAELTCDTVDQYVEQCKLIQSEERRRT